MGFNFDLPSQILTFFDKNDQNLRGMCKAELNPRSENLELIDIKKVEHLRSKKYVSRRENIFSKKARRCDLAMCILCKHTTSQSSSVHNAIVMIIAIFLSPQTVDTDAATPHQLTRCIAHSIISKVSVLDIHIAPPTLSGPQ